jgi:hypothetical protein
MELFVLRNLCVGKRKQYACDAVAFLPASVQTKKKIRSCELVDGFSSICSLLRVVVCFERETAPRLDFLRLFEAETRAVFPLSSVTGRKVASPSSFSTLSNSNPKPPLRIRGEPTLCKRRWTFRHFDCNRLKQAGCRTQQRMARRTLVWCQRRCETG